MESDNIQKIERAVEIDAGVRLLPAPRVDREVAAGALVARPLAGIELKRPIGIVQRRGKELGKTARRFMQLLLKQPASRAAADRGEFEGSSVGSPDDVADRDDVAHRDKV